ncbi:MAG: tetratricopeptide repeat protein [Gemmatimonadetes bacterium]|nr:tetratricopeptide repeat protein [Gemmatimonadota bacterium]
MTRASFDRSTLIRNGPSLLVFGAVLAALVCLAWFQINAPDYWWHLANGKHTLETKSFHFADPFSFTSEGRSYPPTQWAWEVVTYLVHDAAGPAGAIALKVALLAATFSILGAVMLRSGASVPLTLALLFAGLLLARFRFVIRPDLATYLGLAIVWSIVLRYRAGGTVRALRWLPLVTIIWVQFHSGVLFGILTLAGILVGETLAAMYRPAWSALDGARRKQLAVWTAIALAASFVNPNHLRYVSFAIGHVQDYAKFAIVELRPMSWELDSWRMLWIAGIAVLAVARRIDPVPLIVLAPIALITLRTARLFPLFLVLSLPFAARVLAPWFASLPVRAGAGVAALVLAFFIVRAAPTDASRGLYVWGAGINDFLAPVAGADALERIDPAGNLFNSNLYGGYLIWRFQGERKVFTDGRSQLHEPTLTYIGTHDWNDIIEQYGIGHVLMDYRWAEPRLPDPGRMALVWFDDSSLLYVSRGEVMARELPHYKYIHPVTGIPDARLATERSEIANELARALIEAPRSVTARLQAASFASDDGRYGQAEDLLTKAHAIEPWRADIVRNRGYVRGRAGDREGAMADLERSIAMEENAGAFAALGRLYFDAGERDRAVRSFERAIEADPDRADIALDFGYVLEQGGRSEEALILYRDYAARFPENQAIRQRLGGR